MMRSVVREKIVFQQINLQKDTRDIIACEVFPISREVIFIICIYILKHTRVLS